MSYIREHNKEIAGNYINIVKAVDLANTFYITPEIFKTFLDPRTSKISHQLKISADNIDKAREEYHKIMYFYKIIDDPIYFE